MLLYFMRHGIAMDRNDPKCPPEAKRPLTDAGIARTKASAEGLRALGVHPALIVASPFLRARQTAEIVAQVFGYSHKKIIVSEYLLPQSKPQRLMSELSRLKENNILCVGHAPSLDETIAFLLGLPGSTKTALKKAGVAALEAKSLQSPRSQLLWLMPPKALCNLAGKSKE